MRRENGQNRGMSETWIRVAVLVPTFLFCLCLHEFAHAWVATWLGDSTPKDSGRLTIQPMAHADVVGTLLLPSICIYYGLPFFGWAKPVPVDARNFKNPRRDMALVAGAGPLMNLILAAIMAGVLGIAVRTDWVVSGLSLSESLQVLCIIGIQVNLFLAVFNLLPLPPLDGFNVLQAVLPLKWAAGVYRLAPYSGIILLVLLFTGGLSLLTTPVVFLMQSLVRLVT